MKLPDTFSRRKRLAIGDADPLVYDRMPNKVRQQIIHILNEAIEYQTRDNCSEIYNALTKFMRKELGVAQLSRNSYASEEFSEWFLTHSVIDDLLDAIEIIFRIVNALAFRQQYSDKKASIKACADEINERLFEARIGYQFENDKLIQVSSKFEHKEVVVPALSLLSNPDFAAAEHEFLDAFGSLRKGDFEAALIEACKSIESVIKVIAARKGWTIDQTWPLKKLINAVFDNKLIPDFLQTEFAGLRTILENGIGTVRNKAGGHGAGEQIRDVPKYLAAFQLHQTAAAIILLVEAADN